jgi:PAS domain-containing protein
VSNEGGHQVAGGSAGFARGSRTVAMLVVCGILLTALIAAGMAADVTAWSVREGVLLALVAGLAAIAGLLVRRDRLTDQRLAAERSHLSVAVNNIPQGLVLYDASARIIICNQPYLDMFGLSPDIAKPGCTMQRLIAHRKETGSFDGDVDAFCKSIIQTVSLGKATRQLTEAPGGRAIEIINRPLKSGGWVATIEDITERRRAEEKIAHLAHFDGLTQLPNRIQFRERLEQSLKAIRPGEQLAVLYFDIDEFKSVNALSAIRSAMSCSRPLPVACATVSRKPTWRHGSAATNSPSFRPPSGIARKPPGLSMKSMRRSGGLSNAWDI